MNEAILSQFQLKGKTAVVTGGTGVLGSRIAEGLGRAGARIAICGRRKEAADAIVELIKGQGIEAAAYLFDVLDRKAIEEAREKIEADFGPVDILLNAAGGNRKDATVSEQLSFFDLPEEALRDVFDLNLFGGVLLPSQVFARRMAQNPGGGVIINISSMAADRPLTRIAGYSAAKAGVDSLTRWMAVHFAKDYTPALRVNAIAPGFFLTEQNRFLLTDGDKLTPRGQTIITHTPMGRFGDASELVGAAIWLASNASRFVTGIVVPVDGGFSAWSGV